MKKAKEIDYKKIEIIREKLKKKKYIDKAIMQLSHEISTMFN